MRTRIWRRFRPSNGTVSLKHVVTTDNVPINQDEPPVGVTHDVYYEAYQIVNQQLEAMKHGGRKRLWRRHDPHLFDENITSLLTRAGHGRTSAEWLAGLVMQAPRAVAAQRQMDTHPHGYHDKRARLFELIDFNDTYVSTVLALKEHELATFNDETKRLIDRFCRYVKSPCFSNQQWEAITHGLSREISVYRGAIRLGYQVRMTSRREDAMGVDMVITDKEGSSINLDIKTRSSFHFRINELCREGRLGELEREEAEKFGHVTVVNGHDQQRVTTTLLRIDEETYGRTINFELERLEPLRDSLGQIVVSLVSS